MAKSHRRLMVLNDIRAVLVFNRADAIVGDLEFPYNTSADTALAVYTPSEQGSVMDFFNSIPLGENQVAVVVLHGLGDRFAVGIEPSTGVWHLWDHKTGLYLLDTVEKNKVYVYSAEPRPTPIFS